MNDTIPMLTLGIQPGSTHVPFTKLEPYFLHPIPNSNCSSDVRKIACGGTFFVVRLWPRHYHGSFVEEFYVKFAAPKSSHGGTDYFKPINSSTDEYNPFWLLDYKSAIDDLKLGNCYEVEDVFCNQAFIILQMKNNLILGFEGATGKVCYLKKFMDEIGIREIICGPLSFHILIRGTDDMIYYFSTDSSFASFITENLKLTLDFKNKKYVTSALSGRSSFVVYEEEDGSHEILSHGDDQFHTQSGQPSEVFIQLRTPFKGQRIDQIKSGYFHTSVLLESGEVYMCGYNAYTQCGVFGPDQHFIKINFPALPYDSPNSTVFQPTRVICSSIATVFSNKNSFVILGDPVSSYGDKSPFTDPSKPNTVYCIHHNFGLEEQIPTLESNSIECGGWHFVIYKKKILESKCLKYFYENLKKINGNLEAFTDIEIV